MAAFKKRHGTSIRSVFFFKVGVQTLPAFFSQYVQSPKQHRPSFSVLNEARFDRRRIVLILSLLESGVCSLKFARMGNSTVCACVCVCVRLCVRVLLTYVT